MTTKAEKEASQRELRQKAIDAAVAAGDITSSQVHTKSGEVEFDWTSYRAQNRAGYIVLAGGSDEAAATVISDALDRARKASAYQSALAKHNPERALSLTAKRMLEKAGKEVTDANVAKVVAKLKAISAAKDALTADV